MWSDRFQYLLLLGACLIVTLPLELVLRARVYRRWRVALLALLPVVVVYAAWDLLGIVRDWWTYSEHYISGVRFGSVPLEEVLFFVVVPICSLLTYEAVGITLAQARRRRG